MLISSSTLSENIIHVWKPLADQMIRKVLQDLNLLEYMQNHIYLNSSYTGPSKSWRDIQSKHMILNEPGMYANMKFNASPLGLKWDVTTPGQHMDPAIHRRDNLTTIPLFFDPKTGIHIIEREQPCLIELECALVFTDRVIAFDAVNDLMSHYVRGQLLTVTNFSYDYKFPVPMLEELYTLGRLSGVKKGEGMDWITQHSKGRMRLITNAYNPGKHHEMVVHRELYEVLTVFDYNAEEPAIEGAGTSADTITLSFNIAFQFGRVNLLYLKYPIVVNNTLVPEALVHVDPSDAYGRLIKLLQYPSLAVNAKYQLNKSLHKLPVRLPWYDDWHLPPTCLHRSAHAEPFLIGICTLDNEACTKCLDKCKCECCPGRYTKIDLYEDFDVYKLKEPVKEYFKEHPEDALHAESPYSVTVFANNIQVDIRMLKFDGRYLEIANTVGSNRIYRVVLCKAPEKKQATNPWFFVLDCLIVVNKE